MLPINTVLVWKAYAIGALRIGVWQCKTLCGNTEVLTSISSDKISNSETITSGFEKLS